MKIHSSPSGPDCLRFFCVVLSGLTVGLAQDAPQLGGIRPLTNGEVLFQLSSPTGQNFRIDATTNLFQWNSLLTLLSTSVNRQTDSAAPFLEARFYRAVQLTGTNIVTGDLLATDDGEVTIHPINHASFVMSWNGKTIYNDPVGGATPYQGLPRADLILVSHSHTDHFDNTTLSAVKATNAVIIAPQAVYSGMTPALRSATGVMTNGTMTNLMGLTLEAVPAYNSNHPRETGNVYVLTIGGRRIYMTGDTGDIPEMHTLTNIDIAFVCVNVPYTMTVAEATNAVRAFHPTVVYPYHYRNQDGTLNNANAFKQQLGISAGVEVRLRKWY